MNYLYFAEADVQTGGASNPEAMLLPADAYLGSNPVSTTTADFFFRSVDGLTTAREVVRLTYYTTANGGGYKKVNDAMCAMANAGPHSGGFVVVADSEITAGTSTPKAVVYNKIFTGMGVTTVAIT
jgi:hypothetical protein